MQPAASKCKSHFQVFSRVSGCHQGWDGWMSDTHRPRTCKVLIFKVTGAGFLWKEETEQKAKKVIRSQRYQPLLV